ncbi:MAG: glycosyltransferase family 1 protein [Lachnospiraceae bacterium]|nr:glycosyltransferase family 1 protein [Lachnospiraceae bacterium]
MRLKTKIRMTLENVLNNYGYALEKKYKLKRGTADYNILMDDREFPFDEEAYKKAKESGAPITLNWIIPLMGPGSGGHTTIFRTISYLSEMGIHNRIYMCWDTDYAVSDEELREQAKKYYGYDLGTNEIHWAYTDMEYADGCVCTSWQSAYVLRRFHNCLSKFYFVQDYEPWFYPMGSLYHLAERTYTFGFRGVTAGLWLSSRLNKEFGMETKGFRFSYERDRYHFGEKKDTTPRIFFYARPYTARREFEIGTMALDLVAKKVPDLEVVMAGQPISDYPFGFKCIDKGIMPPDQMSDVYSQCDMCLVLSATNMSLLPIEVMASGSVVVSDGGDNNTWELNDKNAILTEDDPWDIADKIVYYLNHRDELAPLRLQGREYAEGITWKKEMEGVCEFIRDSIMTDRSKRG